MSALLQGVMHSVGNQINMSAADCFLCLGPSLTYPHLDPDLYTCIETQFPTGLIKYFSILSIWEEEKHSGGDAFKC